MQFQIENMTCGGCAKGVTKAIHSVDPQARVDIDLTHKRVRIVSLADQTAVAAALESAGFSPCHT